MLLAVIIQPSVSPYAIQVLLQRKGDGTCRFCVDYRKLNSQTVKVATQLPKPGDILAKLRATAVFTTLHLASGYWQSGVNPKDRHETAFVTPWKHAFRAHQHLCNLSKRHGLAVLGAKVRVRLHRRHNRLLKNTRR